MEYLHNRLLPHLIKKVFKKLIFRYRYNFSPPPDYTDLSFYENLLDFIKRNKIYEIDGDVLEIGAFLGGGTYKLCKFYEQYAPDKKVITVDIFDPSFDKIECSDGKKMSDLYGRYLSQLGRSQIEIFKSVTEGCKNLETIVGDSKNIVLSSSKISFAYIDGNHATEYILSDFYKIWDKVPVGGVVAFDDYGYDLPNVTKAIHMIIGKEQDKIARIHTGGLKTIFIQKGKQ